MDEDQVGLDPPKKGGPKQAKYPGEEYLRELLEAATDEEAEDVLTEWELRFATDKYDRLAKYGYREPSEKEHHALNRIEEKLKEARLL
jgi:succinate dehydrogenase/fumarate reductase flavoprotein subunit